MPGWVGARTHACMDGRGVGGSKRGSREPHTGRRAERNGCNGRNGRVGGGKWVMCDGWRGVDCEGVNG